MGKERENIIFIFVLWIIVIPVDVMFGTFPLMTSLGGAIVFWLLIVMGILILADIRDLLEYKYDDEDDDDDENEDEDDNLVEEEKVSEE